MKKLILISAGAFFLLGILLFLYILFPSVPRTVAENIKTASGNLLVGTRAGKATLVLSPNTARGSAGKSLTFDIKVDTGGLKVSGTQFSLVYDPQRIEVESIKVGNFFPQPTVLLSRPNRAEGTFEYALGTLTPKSGQGTIAIVTVKLLTAGAETVLDFSPEGKMAAVELDSKNAAGKFSSAKIVIE